MKYWLWVIGFCFGGVALANNEIPDCYGNKELTALRPNVDTAAIVMLDETTVFDITQRAAIEKQVATLLRPGTDLRVLRFSAYIAGRYTTPVLSANFAQPLKDSERMHIKKPTASAFDQCRQIQTIRAEKKLKAVLAEFFEKASPDIAKSDIVGAIKDAVDTLMPGSRTQHRIFLIVSDMLENSQLTSFYSHGGIRRIDPVHELAQVEKSGLLTDFLRARVFVLGAGVMPADPKSRKATAYVDQATISALKSFWQGYIERSNGQLVEFGQPLLLKPIQ